MDYMTKENVKSEQTDDHSSTDNKNNVVNEEKIREKQLEAIKTLFAKEDIIKAFKAMQQSKV